MNTLKQLTLLFTFLVVTGCSTVGPKIVIDTPEPAEDFVVLCQWYKNTIFGGGHGGKSKVGQDIYVTESGKEVDCGISLTGGDGLVLIKHPIYVLGDGKANYTKDGVQHIVINKTKLDILDEKKVKFEAKKLIDNSLASLEYARSVGAICGFPHEYFEYYTSIKKPEKTHFQRLYNDDLEECFRRVIPLLNKYSPNSYPGVRPTASEMMKQYWNSKSWNKYK